MRISRRGMLVIAVLLVALNLRGAIAAVAPVLPQLSAELSLTAPVAALLTTLPVLCFAGAAPGAAWLARRSGPEIAVLAGCVAIAAGTLLRVVGGLPVLLAGTLVLGIGMAVGNVVVPVVIKRDFSARASTVTGCYTAALAGGAAISAAATAPVATVLGWRGGLAIWAVLACVAAVVWCVAAGARPARAAGTGADAGGTTLGSLLRSPIAWAVTLFLGLQSFAYYSVTAWLPTMLIDRAGLDQATAGGGMSIFQLVGIAGTLLIPVLARRSTRQSWLGAAVAAAWASTLLGLLLAPSAWIVWTLLGGVAQGAGISFALTVLVLRSSDAAATRGLSGMAQLVGYGLGAAGPAVIGGLYQASGGWSAPLLLLTGVGVCLAAAAVFVGANVTVGEPAR